MTRAGCASDVIVALNDYESRQPNVHAGGTARGVAMDSPAAAPSGHHVMGMASHSVRGPSMGWPRADPAGVSGAGPCAGHFHHLWRCRGAGPCHQRKPIIVQRSPWRPRGHLRPSPRYPGGPKDKPDQYPASRCRVLVGANRFRSLPCARAHQLPGREMRRSRKGFVGPIGLRRWLLLWWSGQGRWPRVRSTRASSSWKAGFLG